MTKFYLVGAGQGDPNLLTISGEIENPCMIVIGDVVKLREKISWFENLQMNEHMFSCDAL